MEESSKSSGNGEQIEKKDCFDQRPLTRYQTKVDTGGVACDCGPVEARLR